MSAVGQRAVSQIVSPRPASRNTIDVAVSNTPPLTANTRDQQIPENGAINHVVTNGHESNSEYVTLTTSDGQVTKEEPPPDEQTPEVQKAREQCAVEVRHTPDPTGRISQLTVKSAKLRRGPSRASHHACVSPVVSPTPMVEAQHVGSFMMEEEYMSQMSTSDHKHSIEEDFETTLEEEEKKKTYDWSGQRAYENACRKFGVVPASIFMRKLSYANNIDIKHYGVGPKGAMAIAIPMVINATVLSLNLRGNDLGPEGTGHICRMMLENQSIEHLDLSENRIGLEGMQHVAMMLKHNNNLTRLMLADNEIGDTELAAIAVQLEAHGSLRYLDLSHNKIGAESGQTLYNILNGNDILSELDLNWNHIAGPAATALAKGLKENVTLKVLRLEWNGFGDEGAYALANALDSNSSLEDIRLGNNHIFDKGFACFCNILKRNDTLLQLRLPHNPISSDAVKTACQMLSQTESISLNILELTGVAIKPDVEEHIEELRKTHTSLSIFTGYESAEEKIYHYGYKIAVAARKKYSPVEQAMIAIASYAKAHDVKLVDLFSDFDEDGSMSVTYDEFKEGLRRAKIPITPYQVEQLIAHLDKDGDGEIDFSELVLGAKKYQNVVSAARGERRPSMLPS